jgi:hypothetical protein
MAGPAAMIMLLAKSALRMIERFRFAMVSSRRCVALGRAAVLSLPVFGEGRVAYNPNT